MIQFTKKVSWGKCQMKSFFLLTTKLLRRCVFKSNYLSSNVSLTGNEMKWNEMKWNEDLFNFSRKQRVKIGKTLSDLVTLNSGVPQGGILSPIIFTLYTADLELWCKYSKITPLTPSKMLHHWTQLKKKSKVFVTQ